ncbi:hypothetical protein [Micromonospora kangleipakensis]|nr:hypothetical protein [Micromonospora kangleipakensis]
MNLAICVVAVPLAVLAGATGWLRHRFDGYDGWLHDHGDLLEAAARMLLLLPAIALAMWIFARLRERLSHDTPMPEQPTQPDVAWLQGLQTSAIERLTEHDRKAIALFVELIVDPARSRSRLTEVIDLDHRAVTQQVTISFSLPTAEDGGQALYVPVLQPMKGELVDNFHLRSAAGDSLTTMSYEESIRLASAGLRLLLTEIFAGPETSANLTTLDETVRAAELALLHIVAVRGPISSHLTEQRMAVILEKIKFPDDQSRERVRKYVAALSSSYPIIAVIPATDAISRRLLIKYDRTFIPSSFTKGWKGLLRLGLGLNPDQVAVPVELALTADSYHLRVNAPSNKYVLKQYLQCRHCRLLATRQWRGKAPENGSECRHEVDPALADGNAPFHLDHHFRVRRRRGQSFVHVYMRGYARQSPKMRDLQLLAGFKEVPPGARGRAAVTALATTLLIAVAGNLITRPQGAQVGGLPALMLALPAVAASWFGMSSDKEALVGGSLLARISLIVSGGASIAGVILYLTSPPPAATSVGSIGDPVTFVGITDWRWIALCVISAVNLIYVSYRFTLKLMHYNDLIKRKDLGAGEFAYR